MSEGSVGWATARTELEAPEGPFEMRFTCVPHLEHGEWRLVQWHSSVPVSNEQMGWFLTTTVDQIAQDISEARPDLSVTSAPDGTVTIVFTDIEDSLQLNAFLGDRRWLEVLTAHNELVTRAVADNGGIVVKNQGDGFMLAFASARRALRCARAIERAVGERFGDPGSPIRVRIGLHIGEPVREEADFFGHAVGYAARVGVVRGRRRGRRLPPPPRHAGADGRGGVRRAARGPAQGHRRSADGLPAGRPLTAASGPRGAWPVAPLIVGDIKVSGCYVGSKP